MPEGNPTAASPTTPLKLLLAEMVMVRLVLTPGIKVKDDGVAPIEKSVIFIVTLVVFVNPPNAPKIVKG